MVFAAQDVIRMVFRDGTLAVGAPNPSTIILFDNNLGCLKTLDSIEHLNVAVINYSL